MDDEDYHPNWLYKNLVEDELPWDKKSNLDLEKFFEKYTLHDSFWIGIFHHVAFDKTVTLAFQWDSVWIPDEVKEGSSTAAEWPFLFVQLEGVKEVTKANFDDLSGINRALGGAEIMTLENDSHLAIDDVYGGQTNIVFNGKQSILALNPDSTLLKV